MLMPCSLSCLGKDPLLQAFRQILDLHRRCIWMSTTSTKSQPYMRVLYTHVQSASSADVWPSKESVTVANQSMWDASASTRRPAEWKLDIRNSWTCHRRFVAHRHSQSHSNTASRTSSSTPAPASPTADNSASTDKKLISGWDRRTLLTNSDYRLNHDVVVKLHHPYTQFSRNKNIAELMRRDNGRCRLYNRQRLTTCSRCDSWINFGLIRMWCLIGLLI